MIGDLNAGKYDHKSNSKYLNKHINAVVDYSLNHLLETIENNGEYEKYVKILSDR